jgi:drug/metabolite transporter (DMT)-like permease
MSQRYLKTPKPRQRPDQRKLQRPSTERDVWQRIEKRGKASFLTRSTLILGSLLFSITLLADLVLHRFHNSALEFAGTACLCLVIGYIGGSLLWKRGQTIVHPIKPNTRRR